MIYRWAHCKTELMNELIPVGVPCGTIEEAPATYDEEGNELTQPVRRQKTLREFVFPHLTHDLEDGTTVFLLACKQKSYGRDHGVEEKDLIDWNMYLSNYEYGENTWLTTEEAMALLPEQEV